uniref:ARAD1D05940p n=1 Tax=Blastobotrys adeninivorans TaxID=409370 RepID=A0A060T8F1_BLAAD
MPDQPQQPQNTQQNGSGMANTARPAGNGQAMPLVDLNKYLLEYLNKKGYSKTEAMFRLESTRTPTPGVSTNASGPMTGPRPSSRPGTPIARTPEDPSLYYRAYASLKDWAESSLELYRPELRRLLYPIFVHMFLELIAKGHTDSAKQFFGDFSLDHEILHGQDIDKLSSVSLPAHLTENPLAKALRESKYRIKVSRTSFDLLLDFLHEIETSGGSIVIRLLNRYMDTYITFSRPSIFDTDSSLDPDEGLVGTQASGGSAAEQVAKFNSQPVKLGKLPPDPEMEKDVTQKLTDMDNQAKSEQEMGTGASTLVEEYQASVKQEEGVEAPTRESLPLPQYKTADIEAEVQRVVDSRAKIKLGSPQAPLPSVCMYTFHNTHDGLNCLDFSADSTLVAGGFSDSFVKVWSLRGDKIKSVLKDDEPSTSRRLVGHSGSVYGLSFSPDNRYLLSSSEDKTVRLWSLDTYTALVSYKGHNHPVWDVAFGPYGHYFATASHDQTARLWSCDHIYPLRIFAGHIGDVDTVSFHPNGTYVITGSSDKTCRMWDVNRGNSVRVFIGHTAAINTTAVSPDGRWMASAGEDGVINVWDLGSGRRLKSMKGHGLASIYSLCFSQDGSVLVSGGADNSVRVWDIKRGTLDAGPEPEPLGNADGQSSVQTDGPKRGEQLENKKRREIVATSDHMSVFHTRKTPVYKVHFTPRNVCLAGGAFMG